MNHDSDRENHYILPEMESDHGLFKHIQRENEDVVHYYEEIITNNKPVILTRYVFNLVT